MRAQDARNMMKYYLSSYRLGRNFDKLIELSGGGPLAYIPNAIDHLSDSLRASITAENEADLTSIGISFERLDLKAYFSNPLELSRELEHYSGVWITGGNVFVLRQAMRLSGFDTAISECNQRPFLYSGYSAGVCVLAPRLDALKLVDNPMSHPSQPHCEILWQGLNLIDFTVVPHYKSDHPESRLIDKVVKHCKENDIAYRTLCDGEVLYGENIATLRNEREIRA